jgi:hypothetical protein
VAKTVLVLVPTLSVRFCSTFGSLISPCVWVLAHQRKYQYSASLARRSESWRQTMAAGSVARQSAGGSWREEIMAAAYICAARPAPGWLRNQIVESELCKYGINVCGVASLAVPGEETSKLALSTG